jgi:predicted PurR-regulated permease PerM/CheY-like chemotaxis protein
MLFGTIAALYFAREILIPLAFAFILAFVLSPVVALLQRTRIGRVPSVALTVLTAMAAGGCLCWLIAIQLVDVAKELPRYRQNISAKMEALRIPTEGPFGLAVTSARDIARELSGAGSPSPDAGSPVENRKARTTPGTPGFPLAVQIVQQPVGGLDYLRDFAQPALRPLGLTGLVLLFTVFMLVKRLDLRQRLFRLVGLSQINIMTQALDEAAQRVSRYLSMQLLVNASFGGLFALGLYWIGVPNPALWGVVAGGISALALLVGAEVQVYQRLLAMDQPEAHAIVERFLRDKPLVELYDSVLIPALSPAEQDRHKGAIDTAREEFLFLSVNELITELSEYRLAQDSSHGDAAAAEPGVAAHPGARILCLPANDRADEVTAAMLAQLLEQAGHTATSLSVTHASPAELLELIERRQDDVICVSALPPYAFPPARAMCKLVRERFPKLKLLIGVWGFSGDKEKAKARFGRTQPDLLLTNLAEAVEQIQELVRPTAA